MLIRVAVGRARVVREVRAAAPLMAACGTPVPARAPWLTAVLHSPWATARSPWARGRPVAVVVEPEPRAHPAAAAFLSVRRRGPVNSVTLLGHGVRPLPGGRPPARLPAADEAAADLLAAGIVDLLGSLTGPWSLHLAGLPLGDLTLRALAAALPTAVFANVRSRRLVDELDAVGTAVLRSRDPRFLERRLAPLLQREPDSRARVFLRSAARLHAAIGQLELAVIADGDRLRAALLTLVDGADRWPWWGSTDIGGLREEMGAPLVTLTARREGLVRRPGSLRGADRSPARVSLRGRER